MGVAQGPKSWKGPPNDGLRQDGEPPDNSDMEARVSKIEAALEYIKTTLAETRLDVREIKSDARTDFRLLFGAIIAVAIGLAAIMAKGFGWI